MLVFPKGFSPKSVFFQVLSLLFQPTVSQNSFVGRVNANIGTLKYYVGQNKIGQRNSCFLFLLRMDIFKHSYCVEIYLRGYCFGGGQCLNRLNKIFEALIRCKGLFTSLLPLLSSFVGVILHSSIYFGYIFSPFHFSLHLRVFDPYVFEIIDWTPSFAFYVLLQAKLRQSDWKMYFCPSASRPIDYAFLQEGRGLRLSRCRWKERHLICIHFSQNIVAKSTCSKCSRHMPAPLKPSSSLRCVSLFCSQGKAVQNAESAKYYILFSCTYILPVTSLRHASRVVPDSTGRNWY